MELCLKINHLNKESIQTEFFCIYAKEDSRFVEEHREELEKSHADYHETVKFRFEKNSRYVISKQKNDDKDTYHVFGNEDDRLYDKIEYWVRLLVKTNQVYGAKFAAFYPVRTASRKDMLQDLFCPFSAVILPSKTKSMHFALKIIAYLGAILLDFFTFPIRLIHLKGRVRFNKSIQDDLLSQKIPTEYNNFWKRLGIQSPCLISVPKNIDVSAEFVRKSKKNPAQLYYTMNPIHTCQVESLSRNQEEVTG